MTPNPDCSVGADRLHFRTGPERGGDMLSYEDDIEAKDHRVVRDVASDPGERTARAARRPEIARGREPAKLVTDRVLLLRSEGVVIEWEVRLPGLVARFHGRVEGDAYRTTMEEYLRLAQARGAKKLVLDLREAEAPAMDDQRWTTERWFPQAVYGGIVAMAFVSSHLAARSLVALRCPLGETRLETACFDSPAGAFEWLHQRR
jgi:hypothetical protein